MRRAATTMETRRAGHVPAHMYRAGAPGPIRGYLPQWHRPTSHHPGGGGGGLAVSGGSGYFGATPVHATANFSFTGTGTACPAGTTPDAFGNCVSTGSTGSLGGLRACSDEQACAAFRAAQNCAVEGFPLYAALQAAIDNRCHRTPCGGVNQRCCANGRCNPGLACNASTGLCSPCGTIGHPCCNGVCTTGICDAATNTCVSSTNVCTLTPAELANPVWLGTTTLCLEPNDPRLVFFNSLLPGISFNQGLCIESFTGTSLPPPGNAAAILRIRSSTPAGIAVPLSFRFIISPTPCDVTSYRDISDATFWTGLGGSPGGIVDQKGDNLYLNGPCVPSGTAYFPLPESRVIVGFVIGVRAGLPIYTLADVVAFGSAIALQLPVGVCSTITTFSVGRPLRVVTDAARAPRPGLPLPNLAEALISSIGKSPTSTRSSAANVRLTSSPSPFGPASASSSSGPFGYSHGQPSVQPSVFGGHAQPMAYPFASGPTFRYR